MIKRPLTIILSLLLCSLSLLPCKAEIRVRSSQVSFEQEMGGSHVRSIVQDSRGYIWMGSTSGLIRYDGYSSTLIVPDNKENRKLMLDERVQTVDTWLDHFIFLRLRGRKYSCYDTRTGYFVDYTGDGSYNESFRDYYMLKNGELWLVNEDGQGKVIVYDGKSFSSRRIAKGERLPEEAVPTLPKQYEYLLTKERKLMKDNRGNLIVYSIQGELWYINKETQQLTHLTDIFSKELYRLNGTPRYSIVTDKDGIIWISTSGNGLFAHDPQTGETTHFLKTSFNQDPIQTNFLLNIYEDKAGNIWVCQENMGVSIISKQRLGIDIRYITGADKIDHSNSVHLLKNLGGQVWIGNRYNTLLLADGLMQNPKTVNNYNDDIVAVCQDQQGTVWLGTRQSGVYVGKQNFRHNNDDTSSLSEGKVSGIVCDHQGRIWISFFETYVDLAVPDGKGGYSFRHFFTDKNSVMRPREMLVDHHGNVWLCSNEGLYIFNPDELIRDEKAYKHLNTDAKDPNTDEIHCIYEDTDTKKILAGTTGRGVAVFDNNNPKRPVFKRCYTTADGLPNNNVQQIIKDGSGALWFGTDMGLACYNNKENRVTSMTPANTMQGNMFTEHAACRLDDGRLAFGTRHGIMIINPATVTPWKPLFNPYITDININGTSIHDFDNGQLIRQLEENTPIRLNYNENTLVFHFSDFEYAEGISTKFTFRLKGYDEEWSPLTIYNLTIYRNLPPGTYVMEVRVQNSNGLWSEGTATQTIIISPPIWATWWAYLIYIIMATIIGITIYHQLKRVTALRNRIKVEQQLTEFKMQFFTNISHEFRTPLTIIRGATEHMRSYERIPAKLKLPAFSIQKSTDRLLRMINQLLEFSKMHENKLQLALEETEIVGFLRDIYSTFKEIADNKHISYLFTTNAKTITAFIDRSFLDKIAYNLISNAFKYTPSHGEITLKLRQEENKVLFMVEDTGIGIPKDKQKELFERFNQSAFSRDSIGIGLHLTNELVRVHHGTISYKENPKRGSIFTVALPTDRNVYSEQDFMASESALLDSEHTEGTVLKEYKEPALNPLNDRRVLIVEDDNDVKYFLLHEIQRYFICQCALDGNDALTKIKEEKPDLIISDIMMPIMSGLELTEKIRQDKDIADIPIILLTALSGEKNLLKGLKNGADAYIEKPFSIAVLIAKCRQLIEQRDRLKNQYAQEKEVKVSKPDILVNEQDKRFKEQLDYWLSNHYHEANLDIDTFAESMGYGRTTFYKRVKRIMGQTPNDYLKSIRMNHAAEMLNDDRLTVAEISYKVGIDDPYYFSKSFKSYFGVSPTQYRKGERAK